MSSLSGSKPKSVPLTTPPKVVPTPTPVADDENSQAAMEAIRKRELLAKGRKSTLLTGLGGMGTQGKTLLG